MSVAAIVSGIFAVAKAVPIVMNLIEQVADRWISESSAKQERKIEHKKEKLHAITMSISRAVTNEERKYLSELIADINKL